MTRWLVRALLAPALLLGGCGGPAAPVVDPPAPRLAPDSVVVATPEGVLLELGPDGAERSLIAERQITGGPPGHLAVTADRGTVYFDRGPRGCWSEFTAVRGPSTGGTGAWPAPSPDGLRVAALTGADPCRPDRLVVYDVATGAADEIPMSFVDSWLTGPLSWSADQRRIAVGLAGATPGVRLVTLAGNSSGASSGVAGAGGGQPVAAVHIGGSVELLTLEACCGGRYTLVHGAARRTVAGPGTLAVGGDRVAFLTATGALSVGAFPDLRDIPGRFAAAAP